MTQEDTQYRNEIINMATKVYGECDWHESALHHLEAFAKLVAESEREACAKVADEWIKAYPHPSEVIAKTIRARGATE